MENTNDSFFSKLLHKLHTTNAHPLLTAFWLGFFLIFSAGVFFSAQQISDLGKSYTTPNSNAQEPPIIGGWLHANGMGLFDEGGHYIRLTGVNTQKYVPPRTGHDCWNPITQDEINNVSSWGFNASSIAFSWGDLEPTTPTKNPDGSVTHFWDQNYLSSLDSAITQMSQKNREIILKFKTGFGQADGGGSCVTGGMPPWLYPGILGTISTDQLKCDFFLKPAYVVPGAPIGAQPGAIEAWKFLVDHYKNNNHVVGVDMINEPYPSDILCDHNTMRQPLQDYYVKVGTAVQQINPKLLLIYEDSSDRAAKQGRFTLGGPVPLPNSVYSFHLYQDNWNDAKLVVDAFLNRAKAWNVPLWMGEFHPPGFGVSDPQWPSYTQSLMDYLRQNGVSWGLTDYGGCCGIYTNGVPNTTLIQILQSGFEPSPTTLPTVIPTLTLIPSPIPTKISIPTPNPPTPTPTPPAPTTSSTIRSCTDYCRTVGYGTGTCRQNSVQCSHNGEVYQSGGNKYCHTGEDADTCCCK